MKSKFLAYHRMGKNIILGGIWFLGLFQTTGWYPPGEGGVLSYTYPSDQKYIHFFVSLYCPICIIGTVHDVKKNERHLNKFYKNYQNSNTIF